MRALQTWGRNHPFQTVAFLIAAVAVGVGAANESLPLFVAMALMALLYFFWAWVFTRDTTRMLCIALAVALCAAPTKAHAVQYALGGVVLLAACGISYVGCRAIKCAKKIPAIRGTNAVEEFVVAGEDCEYGAAFWWGEECYAERFATTNREPVVMVLNIFVESATNCQSALSAAESQSVQSLDELRDELAAHGLAVPDSPRNAESYSRNRHPVTAEQVPFKFHWPTRTVSIGAGGVMVQVESSTDLRDWQPLVNLNAAVGTVLAIPDLSHGRQFYRVTTGGPTP